MPLSAKTMAIESSPSSASIPISKFDDQSKSEFLLLIHCYLNSDVRYKDVASKLLESIEKNQDFPMRYDVSGKPLQHNIGTFTEYFRPFGSSIPGMFQILSQLQAKQSNPPVRGLPIRFFASRRTALDRLPNENFLKPPEVQAVIAQRPSAEAIKTIHPIKFLKCRELGRTMPFIPSQLFRREFMYKLDKHTRILGHLSSIFCVAFDRTGHYIFTGADDNLIKVWDSQRCLLRFTFRGHSGELTDMSVAFENDLLATGSVDRTVRFWCLRKGKTIRVYKGHGATINTVSFIPRLVGENRWVVSAGNDCSVVFHRYNQRTLAFQDPPTKYNERASGGARIVSSSHSPGGNLVIMGDTHQAIIMYKLNDATVERLREFTAHTDRVDTLVWANKALRFVSGSKDATAKAWSFRAGCWDSVELKPPFQGDQDGSRSIVPTSSQSSLKKSSNNGYKITMLCWSLDDDLVVSIGSDYLLRTWDWKTGRMLAKYGGHQNETYALLAHPLHKELVISAGHDGLLIVWNIYCGKQLSKHRNENNNREAVAIFDMSISPDGTSIACVDSMGNLSIYGIANNHEAMVRPHEQFFSTDYRLLQVDADGMATDDDTGISPELLPPPFFVSSDGSLHSEQDQRLVPGNDIKSDDVIKPCAWLKRDIVPPMGHSLLEKYREERVEFSRLELLEFERKSIRSVEVVEVEDINDLMDSRGPSASPAKRHRRRGAQPGQVRRTAGTSNRGNIQRLAEFILQTQPRYVLDEEWTDDENDRSFSLGEEEDENDEGALTLRLEHSSEEESSSGSEEQREGEEVEDDEEDSDFELGRRERDTVFRERSTWTVTGKRKRKHMAGEEQQEQEQGPSSQGVSSSQASEELSFRSQRLRARAAARQLQYLPTEGVQLQPATGIRRIKTRSAFIPSSEGEEQEGSISLGVDNDNEKSQLKRRKIRGRIPKKKRRAKRIKIELEKEEEEDEDARTSKLLSEPRKKQRRNLARQRRSRSSLASGEQTDSVMQKEDKQQHKIPSRLLHCCDYPNWMRMTERKRFPYYPQLGDQVVYFLQGHKAYLEEMEKNNIIPKEYGVKSHLDAQEICYVDEIQYVNKPVHMADVQLARVKNGKRIGASFHICYHDAKDVIDYLVLKQHYDAGIAMKLTQGDRVEAIVDDKIYTGKVISRSPFNNEEYPSSEWSSVSVRWDNGDEDRFNPWDLLKWTPGRKSETLATKEELAKFGEYRSLPGEWPVPDSVLLQADGCSAEDLYLNRVLTAIEQLGKIHDLEAFLEPVDLKRYKNYIGVINYPIDLGTIEERIRNRFYRRSISLLHDIQYLAKNAKAFNDAHAKIVHFAFALVETIFVFMENWIEQDAIDLFNRLDKSSKLPSWERKLDTIHLTQMAHSSAGHELRFKKEQQIPLWSVECREMVDQLIQSFYTRVTDRDMNERAFDFLGKFRTTNDSIAKFRCPEKFVTKLREFLSGYKNIVVEEESRRSKIFLAILDIESLLNSKAKPILAKYKRMAEEVVERAAEVVAASASSSSRGKRVAALMAQTNWRNYEDNEECQILGGQLAGIIRRTSQRISRQQLNEEGPSTSAVIERPSPSPLNPHNNLRPRPTSLRRSMSLPKSPLQKRQRGQFVRGSRGEEMEEYYDEREAAGNGEFESSLEEEEEEAANSDSEYHEEEAMDDNENEFVYDEEQEVRFPRRTQSGRIVRPNLRPSYR